MAEKSIGLIELSSVAAGFEVADTMLKAGNVRLLLSRSICSGKYMVLIGGEEMQAGRDCPQPRMGRHFPRFPDFPMSRF